MRITWNSRRSKMHLRFIRPFRRNLEKFLPLEWFNDFHFSVWPILQKFNEVKQIYNYHSINYTVIMNSANLYRKFKIVKKILSETVENKIVSANMFDIIQNIRNENLRLFRSFWSYLETELMSIKSSLISN